jgi:predicted nucleotidyltransferase
VGSKIHGLNHEGQDDTDEMGIFIEPPEYVLGLRHIEHYTYRTQPEGVRSGPGDLDLTLYAFKKYMNLASKGNPSIIGLIFIPPEFCSVHTSLGAGLQSISEYFWSKRAIRQFLGYMKAQKERLFGERGGMKVNRPELIEAHGFDTKYAMHALRLGYQGVEFAKTKRISFPMPEFERQLCMAVRKGERSLDDIKREYTFLESQLEKQLINDEIPQDPKLVEINAFMLATYQRHWKGNLKMEQALKVWN